ncbi:LuxR C-terminal-related transcriptional regulator [Streptomyces sp. NBC_01754]|uniref:response regulator transcription factor n=1 Tax=Streptomyces sp. NBC_01754 TaxID=2975930 RepID=UPI002DD990DB|nr:LuxR C-terminal-related transcriptional regulator [Streptomyces sp. NBC_01754]WSC95615.1 LuxR C-terminal-related transcriptional regulator [Streptomyces sp. NBC_01754]
MVPGHCLGAWPGRWWRGFLDAADSSAANPSLLLIQKQLTPRQQEVLALIGRGLTNPQIAHALDVGLATVKDHVQTILTKLGAPSRVLVARLAWEARLVA